MNQYLVDFESLNWESGGKGARFKSYEHGGTRVRLIEFTQELEHPHWCSNGHIVHVLEGRLEIAFENSVETYEPGHVVFIPDGEKHRHIPKPLSSVVRLLSIEKQ